MSEYSTPEHTPPVVLTSEDLPDDMPLTNRLETLYMKNQNLWRNMFEDLPTPTQKMAQKALPMLIASAQKGEPVIMCDLAKAVAPHLTQFNYAMRWVLSSIHTTLWELERLADWIYGEIPGLTAIVLASDKTPTNWMDQQTRVDPNRPLPWEDYETCHVLPVFEYPHWDKVLAYVKRRLI